MNNYDQETLKNFDNLPDSSFVRLPVVTSLLSISKSTLFRKIEKGEFPKAINITQRTVAWNVGQIRDYLNGMMPKKVA